ncbi:MAG: hypothetical protein N2485_08720, partial [bacterium]|nr:hypothetical protein [bacterium]
IGTLGYIISLKGKGNKNIIFTGDIKLGENETETLAELKNLKLPINPYILITESTNADKEGYANAEKYVIDNLDKIIKQNNKELFIITTFASNIERLQGIVEIAKKYKKRIVILGKSLFYSFNFMKKNNLIDYDNIYINTDNIKVTCTENDIVIVTGNQGENNSGLTRINELLYV